MEPEMKSKKPLEIFSKLFKNRKRKNFWWGGGGGGRSLSGGDGHPSGDESTKLNCLYSTKSSNDLEWDALHVSREDNPYLQITYSQDHLDFTGLNEETETKSPEHLSCSSPTRSLDPLTLTEIHSHLVRSPPPVSWPISPRSNGTFSPDSADGLDPYDPYIRSHSEEHILSPCRDLLRQEMYSPIRGVTPDFIHSPTNQPFTTSSPRFKSSSSSSKQPVWRNMSTSGDESSMSPKYHVYNNDVGAMNNFNNRNFNRNNSMSRSIQVNGQKISGDSFFSSWRGGRQRKSDIKSMENLNVDSTSLLTSNNLATRKSISTLGGGGGDISPCRGFTSLKKSITLKPKRGPIYMDIESQS